MKIYKNPFVSRRSYFIPVAPQRVGKMEASATKGYAIEEINGEWNIRSGSYYNFSLKNEMPIVGNIDKKVLQRAVIDCGLDAVKGDANDRQR